MIKFPKPLTFDRPLVDQLTPEELDWLNRLRLGLAPLQDWISKGKQSICTSNFSASIDVTLNQCDDVEQMALLVDVLLQAATNAKIFTNKRLAAKNDAASKEISIKLNKQLWTRKAEESKQGPKPQPGKPRLTEEQKFVKGILKTCPSRKLAISMIQAVWKDKPTAEIERLMNEVS